MDSVLRKKINDLANDVLLAYNISTPITDIDAVVKKMGGAIHENEALGLFSDGRVKKEKDVFSISVPVNQNNARRNFTIAHELGHLFLHMGYKIDDELWEQSDDKVFNRGGSSEIELQANEFAAAFLMPKAEYKKVMDDNTSGNIVFIGQVAGYFHVSIDAASYRGKWLGYLQW